MKKALKSIYTVSILIFLVLWILSKFMDSTAFNTMEIRNIFVVIYLISSLIYYKMDVKDKIAEIQELKLKLEKTKKEI